MAREINRRFDAAHGVIVVTIEDDLGTQSVHSIAVLEPDGKEADVKTYVSQILTEAKKRAEKIKRAFKKHGWNG